MSPPEPGELSTNAVASGAYDARGSLLRVAQPDRRLIEYLVDAAGRRIAKKVNGAVERKWLYRYSLKPIAELDASGDVVAVYGYAEKYTTPSFVEAAGKRYRVISDHLGSPRLVVNATNSADRPVRGDYAAFGEASGSGLGWMPFGFAGGIYDEDTRLVRFGARDYDPVAGRWTSKDRSRFVGGLNFYVYAYSDPVNFIDVDGHYAIVVAPPVAAAAGAAVALWGAWDCATNGCRGIADLIEDIFKIIDIPNGRPPFRGPPGEVVRGPTLSRRYGRDGLPEVDRELPHPDEKPPGNGDHCHDWGRPRIGDLSHKDRGFPRIPAPGDPPPPRGHGR